MDVSMPRSFSGVGFARRAVVRRGPIDQKRALSPTVPEETGHDAGQPHRVPPDLLQ